MTDERDFDLEETKESGEGQLTQSAATMETCQCDRAGLTDVVLVAVRRIRRGRGYEYVQFVQPDHQKEAGYVGFPGGKVEDGESLEDAAVRVAFTELGVQIVSVETVGCGEFREWETHATLMSCEVLDPEALRPTPTEAAAYMWLTVAELTRHPQRMNSNTELGHLLEAFPEDDHTN